MSSSSFSLDLHSLVSKCMPRRQEQSSDTDSAGIPYSSSSDVDALRRDYEEKTRTAQDPTLESCFKYVHSTLCLRVSPCLPHTPPHSPRL